MPEAATKVVQILQHRVANATTSYKVQILTPHGQRLQHHTKFKYYNTAWSKITTTYKVLVFTHPCDLTTKDRKDHPEHKDHHKEVSLLLQWHLQFFIANNDACQWEHKDRYKEVPLLLQ
jgi:hypothetical protein